MFHQASSDPREIFDCGVLLLLATARGDRCGASNFLRLRLVIYYRPTLLSSSAHLWLAYSRVPLRLPVLRLVAIYAQKRRVTRREGYGAVSFENIKLKAMKAFAGGLVAISSTKQVGVLIRQGDVLCTRRPRTFVQFRHGPSL